MLNELHAARQRRNVPYWRTKTGHKVDFVIALRRAAPMAIECKGYTELPVTNQQAVGVDGLPDIHLDPFDRLLLAQALSEGTTLVTGDSLLATYPGPIRKI